MQIREITLHGFMTFTGPPTQIRLPPVGLVLVSGQNGAGKSSLVEAVSYGLWGKTLRGTDPRRKAEAGAVFLETGFGMQAHRHWHDSHRNVLEVALRDPTGSVQPFEFDTTAKAQDHVTGVVGEWDTWRRSCAFSSVDDLSFATATDAERKRLLESLLGLARFDRALDACRLDLKTTGMALAATNLNLVRARTTREEAQRSLVALEAMAAKQAPTTNVASLRARLEVVQGNLKIRQDNWEAESKAANAARVGQANHTSAIRRLEAQIRDLADSMACPMCSQAWPDQNQRDKRRYGLEHDLEQLKLDAPPAVDETRLRAADEALRDCRAAISALTVEVQQAEAEHKRYQEAQDLVKQAKLNILDVEDAETVLEADLAAHEYQQRHLQVTDTVLGTKGARAHMLTSALAGLEAVANLWLERIARVDAPLKLQLSPYTEKKTGGTADAISMDVVGAGGGRGYKGASGGERRRIDVAIMLALGEIAQLADGRVSPTMFFDEVFDSLDAAGVEAVALALDQLAQDRCVVIMSHSAELISHLVPDLRLHVDNGVIEYR